jgi:hypothetical protein
LQNFSLSNSEVLTPDEDPKQGAIIMAKNKQANKQKNRFSLSNSGVTTDEDTKKGAIIMGISCLPYLFVQVPLY